MKMAKFIPSVLMAKGSTETMTACQTGKMSRKKFSIVKMSLPISDGGCSK